MKRRFTALLVTIAMTLGLVFAVQAPAAASFYQCDSLAVQMCGWKDVNYNGAFRTFSGTRYTCYNLASDWDQELSSVWNHRPLEELRFYSNFGCGGGLLIINPNSGTNNLGSIGGGWNDIPRSWKIVWD